MRFLSCNLITHGFTWSCVTKQAYSIIQVKYRNIVSIYHIYTTFSINIDSCLLRVYTRFGRLANISSIPYDKWSIWIVFHSHLWKWHWTFVKYRFTSTEVNLLQKWYFLYYSSTSYLDIIYLLKVLCFYYVELIQFWLPFYISTP